MKKLDCSNLQEGLRIAYFILKMSYDDHKNSFIIFEKVLDAVFQFDFWRTFGKKIVSAFRKSTKKVEYVVFLWENRDWSWASFKKNSENLKKGGS